MYFNDLNIQHYIKEALEELNFEEMKPVQEQVIPLALSGSNLIVQSQTGSGKTHAFLIPILDQMNDQLNEVQAVITAPSRELAEQIFKMAEQINQFHERGIRIVNYVGGTDKQRQLDKLGPDNQPHLVIGTPGRIFDLMSEHALWVQTCQIFVVDEADMTLDMGFLNIVDDIASRMPEKLQMMVFSATIPQALEVFLNKYMDKPQRITIENQHVIASTIKNYLLNTKGKDRKEMTYQLLTMGHPFLALIFTNTKQYADELAAYLKDKGLKVAKIHGDVESRERKRIMKQIRNLEYQYVVATDLAARGIDIPGTSMVINTEIPKELEYFIHRVGRTGRNGLEGYAYTLYSPDDDSEVSKLEDKGIEFITLDLIQGKLVERSSRDRRIQRKNTKIINDPEVNRLIIRHKNKKVKPGYKRKLQREIKAHQSFKAKQKGRQQKKIK